jgi:PAS domain S-box-containing protein
MDNSGGTTSINTELQATLRDAGVAIWSYDGATGRFILDATCRVLFDLDPDQSLERELLRERLHPEDLPTYLQAIRQAMADGGGFAIDYRIVRRDGSVRFLSGRGRVRPHLPSEPIIINGVCIDVTERRRLEQQLHATELQLRTLADSFPGLFCYVDRDFVVRFLSTRYVEHIGARREELIGKHLAELTGRVRFLERKATYDKVLAGHPHTFEEARPMPDGGVRHYALTYLPDRGLNGEVRGFMAIGLDITELRRVEQALKERSAELARSNHDLEQFAYVASHDLKAPLRAIEMLVQWLADDLIGVETGDVQKNLTLLGRRTSRLNRLLDDLLAYSKAGRGVNDAVEVDSRQMALDIAAMLAPPPCMRIEADASLPVLVTWAAPLEQVLRNLVNNAIKHHPTGAGVVRISAEQRDADIVFAVEDDGAGIPAEHSEKVFQMFQTLKPRDEVEGSGMGLAIVKRLVEWQGGRIWFRPGRGGRGTVFKFIWRPLPAGARPGQGTGQDMGQDTGKGAGDATQRLPSAG